MTSIEDAKNQSTIIFCQNKDLFYDRFDIFVINLNLPENDPKRISPPILLPDLTAFSGEAMFFQGLLYVLNSTAFPNELTIGRVMVYKLDMDLFTAEIVTQFKENQFGIPYNFDISGFEIVHTDQNDTLMAILLDAFGHSIYFGTFLRDDPDTNTGFFQFDFEKFLNDNNLYLSENSWLYDIELVREQVNPNEYNTNSINYTFIISSSDTALFQCFFQFDTRLTNGTKLFKQAFVSDVYLNYGPAEHLYDLQVLGDYFGATYYNRSSNSVLLAFYVASDFGPPTDFTIDVPMIHMLGGLNFSNIVVAQDSEFVLVACGADK